jgi:serine/threonine protein kinase
MHPFQAAHGSMARFFLAGVSSTMQPATPHAEASLVQLVVSDKYAVERLLGFGATSVVLAARHTQLREKVALKVLRPEVAYLPGLKARFEREARAAVRIKSEHIVRVLDVGVMDTGLPYIVMEFLDGCDLQELLRTRGAVPIPEAVEYVAQACVGVAEAHATGIIHRDLKPSNLYLVHRPDGSPLVKVLDFGVSKFTSDTGDPTDLTLMEGVLGSPKYMSPEQARSARSVDARADVWSLGVILYHLLAGRPPFAGESTTEVLSAILASEPKPLTELLPDAPAPLELIVRRCLEKKVDRRIQSVAELARALVPWVRPETRALVSRVADPSRSSIGWAEPSSRVAAPADTGTSASSGTAMGWQTRNWLHPKPARVFAAALALSMTLVIGAIWLARGPDSVSSQATRPQTPLRAEPPPTPAKPSPLTAIPPPADLAPAPAPAAAPSPEVAARARPSGASPSAPRVAPRKTPSPPPAVKAAAPLPASAPTSSARDLRSLIDERQ